MSNQKRNNFLADRVKDFPPSIPVFEYTNTDIPYILHLTHYDRASIPQKVWRRLNTLADRYEIRYYSNEDCEMYLETYYGSFFKDLFCWLKTGAHKADLFRYCVLYREGGVYLDIKISPQKSLHCVFDHGKSSHLYTCLSPSFEGSIFQGIIAVYPGHAVFKKLINDFFFIDNEFFFFNMPTYYFKYGYFVTRFYHHLLDMLQKPLVVGAQYKKNECIFLFNEKNQQIGNQEPDRYNKYCNVFDRNGEHLFQSRYSDYPWT